MWFYCEVQRLAALKWRIQFLGTGVKAVSTALEVVKRIKNELEKEHSICDDDTLKYLEEEEKKLRDKLVTLSGELDSEVHQVEAEISKLESKVTELEVELMKRNSNLGMQLKELKEDQVELELELKELSGEKVELEKRNSNLGMQLKELKDDQVEHVKKNSKLELELKELNGEKVELENRNSYLGLQLSEIKEEKMALELELEKQMKHMKSEESGSKREARRITGRNEALKDQKKTLPKLLKEKEEELLAGNGNEENIHQDVSPLQNLVDRLPNTMKTILAPKGSFTGDEFGAFMGGFVNIAAYTVTLANKTMGITAMSALASLLTLMISTMFNNIVTYILTVQVQVQNDQPRVVKAFTSLPWIMLGGVLPIAIGGFIPRWGIRAIVTGIVTFVLKIAFAVFSVLSYKVPKKYGFYFVILGMAGMAIAAGVPEILEWIVKLSVKKACPSI
ncbi:hypothetical protein YC2023_036719 [Brassica napus]